MRRCLPTDLVEIFLLESVDRDSNPWSIVSECLEDDLYVVAGVEAVICRDVPHEVTLSALAKVDKALHRIEHCVTVGTISDTAISLALVSPDVTLAVSVAIARWKAHFRSETRFPMCEAWRRAFLRSAEISLPDLDAFWVNKILQNESDLIVEWVSCLVSSGQESFGFHTRQVAKKVIVFLDFEQRCRILKMAKPSCGTTGAFEVINALVGDDSNTYRHLLQSGGLKEFHLYPLMGGSNAAWRDMVILALDHGYTCDEVIRANLEWVWLRRGDEFEAWTELRHCFENLRKDGDPRVANIGDRGVKTTTEYELRAEKRRHEEAVHGFP